MKKTIGVLRRIFGEVFWIAVTGAVIVGGIQGFQLLKSNRAVVEIAPAERPVPVVATLEAAPWDAPLPVRAQGFVQPLRTVSLASPAGGTIAELHPAIVNERGTFEQGEVLVRFDDRAERANLRQSEANITAARTQLELETTRLERTRALFERGSASQQALDEALGRFDEAAARLDGLIAGQAAIEVALTNQEIRAPFAGAILSKSAEVGSVIGAGQAIAEAYTDKRLTVDVKLSEAAAGLIPGLFEGAAPRAEVQLDFAGQTYSGAAKVASVAPGIDPRTRTIGLTFELENGGRLSPTGGATLASGMPPASRT